MNQAMHPSNELLLAAAAERGDTEMVRHCLAAGAEATVNGSWALSQAAQYGHTAIVALLIAVSDPKAHNSEPLWLAAHGGHLDCVKLLIPVSDPRANDSLALFEASAMGQTACVCALLPHSDPKARDSRALVAAVKNNHADIVDILWGCSAPDVALNILKKSYHSDLWQVVEQRILAEQQHVEITTVLDAHKTPAARRVPKI